MVAVGVQQPGPVGVEGWHAPGLGPVKDALAAQLASPGELGAAVTVIAKGEVVAELWGGWADIDRTQPWRSDTLANAYSVGKAVVATLALQLVDEGAVGLDEPVARYWPAFAEHGKEQVTVREALCHRAGVPAIRERLSNEDLWDFDRMCAALAATAPWWDSGARHAYHTNTYGHLVGGLAAAATGELPGARLRRLCEPLDADLHFGLDDAEHGRCAEIDFDIARRFELADIAAGAADEGTPGLLDPFDPNLDPETRMTFMSYANPPGYSSLGVVNTPEWRRAQVPSTNGQMTATGIARFYHALLNGQILAPETLAEAARPQSTGFCPTLGQDVVFGLGFQPWTPHRPLGHNPGGFGHFGSGGALGFADPVTGLVLGYVVNHIVPRWQNAYNRAVVDSVYRCLA